MTSRFPACPLQRRVRTCSGLIARHPCSWEPMVHERTRSRTKLAKFLSRSIRRGCLLTSEASEPPSCKECLRSLRQKDLRALDPPRRPKWPRRLVPNASAHARKHRRTSRRCMPAQGICIPEKVCSQRARNNLPVSESSSSHRCHKRQLPSQRLPQFCREIGIVRRPPAQVTQKAHPLIVRIAGCLAEEIFEEQRHATKRPPR
jgi:hypothetical protein